MVALPESQHTINKNHHPPIIDDTTWNTVQNIFKNHKGEKVKEEDPLLKSLLYCYHCHNKLIVLKKQDKYKDKITIRRYIICGTATRKVSNKTCYKQYINYDKLEEKVLEKISNTFAQYLNSNAFNSEELL